MKKITLLAAVVLASASMLASAQSLADTQTLWAKFVKNTQNEQSLTSQGNQMVLAQDGGLYAIGNIGSTSAEQMTVLTDGTNSVDVAQGIAYSGNSANQGLIIMKLSADGNLQWTVAQTNGEAGVNENSVAATADGGLVALVNLRHSEGYLGDNITIVDAQGVNHVIDWTVDERSYRSGLIKINAQGGIEWMREIEANATADEATYPNWSQTSRNIGQGVKTYALDVDNDGNIYVGGLMCANLIVGDVTIPVHNVSSWNGNAQNTVGNMFVIKFDQNGNYIKHLVSEGEATQESVRTLKVVGNKIYMSTWVTGLADTEFSVGGKAVTPATINSSWALAELDTDLNVNWLQFYESTVSGSAWQMPTMTVAGDHIYLMGTAKYGYTIGETNYTNTPANKARQSWLMQFDRSNGNATAATVLATGKMQMQHGFFGGYEGTDGNFYAIERGLTPSASFGSEMILYKFNQETLESDDNVQLALGSCDGQSLVTDGTKVYVMNRFGNKNEAISFYNSDQTFSSASFVWGQSAYQVPVGAVQSLTIEGNSEINLEKGKSLDLVATLMPQDAANSEIIWSSSDEAVVTVSENGTITAVDDAKAGTGGQAVITATSASNPNVKASVKVTATNVTAITTVEGEKAVNSVRYYNVAGMESDVPFKGMNTVVKTYTDGSRTTEKIVK
ncbi:MAG: Ig-like domain-containing protein [Muribaculaceae bacterium]|nr:Ig-like domain-containing protein [Muribaculaceae bacterium]MBR0023079.1 Ig-like domain-containing protein [Muribaculaceae bacterium]